MATKSITITDEAYGRLTSFKDNNESFSDVINKITKKASIFELVGTLSNKEADDLKRNIKTTRERLRKELGKKM